MNNVRTTTIDRIDLLEKSKCTGCSSCIATCPESCISMIEDEDGYEYPIIDEDNCTNCGLCSIRCPQLNKQQTTEAINIKPIACWIKNQDIRNLSSSGGIFTPLAQEIFNRNGVVCGVAFKSGFIGIEHILIESMNDIDKIRRSKFMQSSKNYIFKKIKKYLDSGQEVLFSGTPCEVAGLNAFLNKPYPNLFTVDLICGCVPSNKAFRKYLDYQIKRYNSEPIAINFKDKRKGWNKKGVSIKFANGKEYWRNVKDDYFSISFHKPFLRLSCYSCNYRGFPRVSDITLGDYVGISNEYPELYDDKGTSLVFANTQKGKELFSSINKFLYVPQRDFDMKNIEFNNSCLMRSPVGDFTARANFYKDLDLLSFKEVINKHLKPKGLKAIIRKRLSKHPKFFKKLKNILKRFRKSKNDKIFRSIKTK